MYHDDRMRRVKAAGEMDKCDSFTVSLNSLSFFILSLLTCICPRMTDREMLHLTSGFTVNNIALRDGLGDKDNMEIMC